MDKYGKADAAQGKPVPEPLRKRFNAPEKVKVQSLPCELPNLVSKAVHFEAGARTLPHRHTNGQRIIVTHGVGVIADEEHVHVVRPGDVISSPPGGWHWHGATPSTSMSHVTIEDPGLDLDVDRGNWDEAYTEDLGR